MERRSVQPAHASAGPAGPRGAPGRGDGGLAARTRFRRRFKAVRVVLLLTVLAAVLAWGLKAELRRQARTSWTRTLPVDVVLLRNGYVPERTFTELRRGMPRLEAALGAELARFRPDAPPPFAFTVHGPVRVTGAPPEPPESQHLWHRALHYLRLWRYLDTVHRRGQLGLRRDAICLYVVVEPPRNRTRFVEGFGGGEIGVVRAAIDGTNIDHALLAMAHELLHCLGASDKYDAEGHALEPDGLAEPELRPLYPQRYAEIMVGEVPMDRGKGRTVDSLAEMRVGQLTAAEIGWAAP